MVEKKRIVLKNDSNGALSVSAGESSSDEIGAARQLKDWFSSCDDAVFQPVLIGRHTGTFVYLGGLISGQTLSEIERGLSLMELEQSQQNQQDSDLIDALQKQFAFSEIISVSKPEAVSESILSGDTALILDDFPEIMIFHSAASDGRSIAEPITDQVVRGPRDAFVEQIGTNIMLIRRRIRTTDLKVEYMNVGRRTRTKLAVVHISGIADPGIVNEVHSRIGKIDIDGVLESNYIEQMIQDAPYSPFPTIYNAERPDRVCAALLEGKVAILTDGTPFALTVPALFAEFLHSNEDYYDSSFSSTIIRWIRALGLLIASFLPAFYVAITTIHQDLIQTPLLIRVSGYREDLPYPVLVEAFFMLLTFELVKEAGLRMPKAIGNAVTIVGTLVIGQAAVQAGLVGALMVIVIAVTALTTFILPNYSFMLVVRYSSFPMLFLAGMFGFMGILVGLMFILAHLTSLRSFGVPYLSPLSPARKEGWKDVFIRAPLWNMNKRYPGLGDQNVRRGNNKPPSPPDSN